jgi:CheY-like chemotaxis protein
VDDDADTRDSMALMLRRSGFQTMAAGSGPDALQAAESEAPDIILLDLAMPGMDGLQVARRFRERACANGKRPFLIALSGYGDAQTRQRCQEAGIDLHLLKPANLGDLEHVLRRLQRIVMPGAERRLPESRRRLWLGSSLQHWSERAMLKKRVEAIREMVSDVQALRARLHVSADRLERIRIRNELCEQTSQLVDESECMRQAVISLQRYS